MLGELINEIQELQEYKKKYEYVQKDKEVMSEKLYEYMMREYGNMSREERVLSYRTNSCSCCRYRDYCEISLPENIWEPIKSDRGWIPGRVTCGKFDWS